MMYLEDTLLSSQQHAANKTATYQKQKQKKTNSSVLCFEHFGFRSLITCLYAVYIGVAFYDTAILP